MGGNQMTISGIFEKKFELWNSKLLDLSRRNRMLNYRTRKTGTFHIEGEMKDLFDELLKSGFTYDVTLPNSITENITEDQVEENNYVKSRTRKLEYIRKTIKSADDEMGFNIGYIAFGLLSWSEVSNSDILQSPIILVPIEINRETLSAPISITMKSDEEIQWNPVILRKLEEDFGFTISDSDEINDLDFEISKLLSICKQTGWAIENKVLIDTFNFQNLVIQKDLERNKEMIQKNPFIKALTGEMDKSVIDLFDEYNGEIDIKNEKPSTYMQILDADSSQQEAISRARRGDSFVLQGPPGTGKSQTITNIIGEHLGLGKKILFVSEKQAALEVVYNKLHQNGLSDFVLTLHKVKQRKGDIREQLQNSLNASEKKYVLKDENMNLYRRLSKETSKLNNYDDVLNSKLSDLAPSFYYVHGQLSKVLDAEDVHFTIESSVLRLSSEELNDLFQVVSELGSSYLTNTFHHKENGWKYFDGDLTLAKQSELRTLFKNFRRIVENTENYSEKLHYIFPNKVNDNELCRFTQKLKRISFSKEGITKPQWVSIDHQKYINEIEKYYLTLDLIEKKEREILENEEVIRVLFDEDFFNVNDVEKTVKILKFEYKSGIKRMFSSEYKQLFKTYRRLTKEFKLKYIDLLDNLELLSVLNTDKDELDNLQIEKERLIGRILTALDITRENLSESNLGLIWLNRLIKHVSLKNDYIIPLETILKIVEDDTIEWSEIDSVVDEYLNEIELLNVERNKLNNYFDKDFQNMSTVEVLNLIDTLDFSKVQEYFLYKRLKNNIIRDYELSDFIEKIEQTPHKFDDVIQIFKKRFYLLYLDDSEEYHKIGNLTMSEIAKSVNNFKKYDKQTFDLARGRIFKSLSERLPNVNENMKISGGEMGVLKRELVKKSRLLPTRKLIEKLPTLLPRLKPCIMMSPLTVSTYFSSNSDWQFDLVIFDEASQVRPEYAVAAIARGKQIIVAGDSKQMPPTSFFDSSNDLDEDDDDIQDLESILDELSVKIPQTHLNWHYRSKDESLITFSNKKFYTSRLFTFPATNTDTNSSVKFKYVKDGVWESKYGNRIEAKKVVEMVYEHAVTSPDKSLGIVAFGMSQARVIEDEILKLRESNPELESFFDENIDEPFFVKNLENVQGDERDMIILSIGYGKDPQGKFRMNFGPLTKSGGERRLNVAVSRSREIMYVVSSMKGSNIRVEEGVNQNRVIFRDFLEYAEKGVGALIGYNINDSERYLQFDSGFEEVVYDFLRSKGFNVHTQVGDSGYRIDMAVVHPNIPGRYVIAIECDGAAYHSSRTARDRDRLRQDILESKGWMFYRIWSTTWVNDNINEKNRLVEAINNAIDNYSKDDFKAPESTKIPKAKNGISNNLVEVKIKGKKLPRYRTKDVYSFEDNIQELAEIIMLVAKNWVGASTDDLMRHINEYSFQKQRLTQGYKAVYNKAFVLLEKAGHIETNSGMIVDVIEKKKIKK